MSKPVQVDRLSMNTQIDRNSWQSLFDLASRVYAMAPWKWMVESDVFGVEIPGREVFFVSVMGALGDHLSVAIYPDIAALTQFWELHAAGAEIEPERVLEIPQIQLAFVDRKFLSASSLRVIKDLGLRFRGPQACPEFQVYRPGYVSGEIGPEHAEVLNVALGHLIEVAPRFQRKNLWDPEKPDVYLIRTLAGEEFRRIPPAKGTGIEIRLSGDEIGRWRALPVSKAAVEIDFFMLMTPIMKGKERPFYPYLLLGVETARGLVVFQDMLSVETSVEEMLGRIPSYLVRGCAGAGVRPSKILARQGRVAAILNVVAEPLRIEIRESATLPHLDPAKAGLMQFLTRRPG